MKLSYSFHDQFLAAVPLFLVYALMQQVNAWAGIYATSWPLQLVGFGAMFITPAALEVLRRRGENIKIPTLVFVAAWLGMTVCADHRVEIFAVPWFLVTLWIGWQAVILFIRGPRTLARAVMLSGPAMLAVGGAWYFADQAQLEPLGFNYLMVRLTAAHFHFAGFVLPVIAGLVLQQFPGRLVKVAAVGVMVGVPMVATGITLTQMGMSVEAECTLAIIFSISAMATGAAQFVLAGRSGEQSFKTRVMLGFSGISLMIGMVLAILYALRPWVQLPWLQNLPRMWALHGSIQAFGFALCALAGWADWRQPGQLPLVVEEEGEASFLEENVREGIMTSGCSGETGNPFLESGGCPSSPGPRE